MSGCQRAFLIAVLCVVSLGMICRQAVAQSPHESSPWPEQIEAAWKSRQARFSSGVIRWTEDAFYQMKGISVIGKVDSVVVHKEFAFKGSDRYEYFIDGLRWNSDKKSFDHELFRESFNRGMSKSYAGGERHGKFPAGWVNTRETFIHNEDYTLEVPVLAFRPLAPSASWFRFEDWKYADQTEQVNGRRCVKLDKNGETIWLDCDRDFLHARHDWHDVYADGNLIQRVDIDHQHDDEFGWIPRSWRLVEFYPRTKRPKLGYTAEVTAIELNVPVPNERFEIVFGPGTRVINGRTEQKGIVNKNGSFYAVGPGEQRSWEELINAEPTMARVSTRFVAWISGVIFALCAIVSAGILIRRASQR